MTIEPSKTYEGFLLHVFGDYRYFYYNGLPEDICSSLVGEERIKAEKMVEQAIRRLCIEERVIRAAGYLKIKTASTILQNRLKWTGFTLTKNTRSAIKWAIFKINRGQNNSEEILDIVTGQNQNSVLSKPDAIDLLSEFGDDPRVIKILLDVFLSNNETLSASAHSALCRIFKDNQDISNILNKHGFGSPLYIRSSMVKHIEAYLPR